MTIKGMQAWVDYIAGQLDVTCKKTPWGNRYTIPPKTGGGVMEAFEQPGQWVIWRSDLVMNKALNITYVQDDPYYIAFSYRKTSHSQKAQETTWPGDEEAKVQIPAGFSMRALGVYYYTAYFDALLGKEVTDFITSVQCYDDKALMKQVRPVLRQMLEHQGEGLAQKLFFESRVLELASLLIDISEKEQGAEKVPLSAYDASQLHKVLDILAERMANPPGINELAKMTALNESKLKVGFRQLFGTTIFEYLRLLRMEKAADLLKDRQLSVNEVGRRVGYTTPHGFANAFRKYYGATPVEWQNCQTPDLKQL